MSGVTLPLIAMSTLNLQISTDKKGAPADLDSGLGWLLLIIGLVVVF